MLSWSVYSSWLLAIVVVHCGGALLSLELTSERLLFFLAITFAEQVSESGGGGYLTTGLLLQAQKKKEREKEICRL